MSPGIVVARAGREEKATPGGRWRQTWSDEFDGSGLDPSKWDFVLGNGTHVPDHGQWVPGWGRAELPSSTLDADNVGVQGGLLRIRAQMRRRDGCDYTAARIRSRRHDGRSLFAQRYGRFEARVRVPWGQGLSAAIRMLPQDERYGSGAASGEIDLMQIDGERPHEVLNGIHFGSSFPARSALTHAHPLPFGSTVGDWHVYAVEWEPGRIRFYVDDVLTCTRAFWWSCSVMEGGRGIEARRLADLNPWPAPFDQPFYVVMDVAVAGRSPGVPNGATHLPADLVVDWLRVYDKVGGYGETPPRGRGRFPWHEKP